MRPKIRRSRRAPPASSSLSHTLSSIRPTDTPLQYPRLPFCNPSFCLLLSSVWVFVKRLLILHNPNTLSGCFTTAKLPVWTLRLLDVCFRQTVQLSDSLPVLFFIYRLYVLTLLFYVEFFPWASFFFHVFPISDFLQAGVLFLHAFFHADGIRFQPCKQRRIRRRKDLCR